MRNSFLLRQSSRNALVGPSLASGHVFPASEGVGLEKLRSSGFVFNLNRRLLLLMLLALFAYKGTE